MFTSSIISLDALLSLAHAIKSKQLTPKQSTVETDWIFINVVFPKGNKLETTSATRCYKYKLLLMFGLFKKKSAVEKLEEKHKALLEEAYALSKSDRNASDAKAAEAAEIDKQIEALQAKG